MKNTFANPYYGIQETPEFAILYNKTCESSVLIGYENIAAQYGANQENLERQHQLFSAIIKSLGSNILLQKSDVIFYRPYAAEGEAPDFLSGKYQAHFKGRPARQLQSFLILTLVPKNNRIFSYDEKEYQAFLSTAAKVLQLLNTWKCSPRALRPQEINELARRYLVLNFTDNRLAVNNFRKGRFDTHLESGEHIIRSVPLVDIDKVELPGTVADYKIRKDSGTGFPVDFMACLFDIPGCDTLVYNQVISVPDQQKTRIQLEMKRKRHSSIPDAQNTISMEDIDQLMADMARNGSVLVNCHFNILFKTGQEKAAAVYNAIENKLFDNQIIPSKSAYNQLELLRTALPGVANELQPYDKFLTTSDAAICFFLKEKLMKSEQTAFRLYFSDRQGIPVVLDTNELPMETQRISNRNKFVLGPSGSGKSFFMNHLLRQYCLYGMDIVLVDTGHSYSGLCRYMGGTYISYSDETPVTMNPFIVAREEYNEEKRDFVKTLIGLLFKGAGGVLNQVEDTVLNRTVADYYADFFNDPSKPADYPSFNSFYDFSIKHIGKMVDDNEIDFPLAVYKFVLKKFYSGGEYQHLLNKQMTSSLFDQSFIVFEIDSIKEHKILFPVVTVIIMDVFLQKMRLRPNRKALIIEEAWKAIASPMMAGYILYLYKTVRKFRGEAIVVTQDVDDIIGNPIVKDAIISNSDTLCLLDQRKFRDNYGRIAALLNLNTVEQNKIWTINSLGNKAGRGLFKEVYIRRGAEGEVYGVEVSLNEYIAFTTERAEKEAFNIYLTHYPSFEEANNAFVEDLNNTGTSLSAFCARINAAKSVLKNLALLLLLLAGVFTSGRAQALVTDPINEAQTLLNGQAQNSRLDQMNNHESAIQKAQLAAVANLAFINDIQNKIYNGLTQVSSILKNAADIVYCGQLLKQVMNYQVKMVTNAGNNPLLLAFAENSEYSFITKGYDLVSYIRTTILHEGKDLLMDAGDRARLLMHVKYELQLMVGISYTAAQAVWMARQIGILQSLNPWKGYINLDKQAFAADVSAARHF